MVLKIQLKKDYTKNKKLEYQMDKALKKPTYSLSKNSEKLIVLYFAMLI